VREAWRDDLEFMTWLEALGKPVPERMDPMGQAMTGAMWLAWKARVDTDCLVKAARDVCALHVDGQHVADADMDAAIGSLRAALAASKPWVDLARRTQ